MGTAANTFAQQLLVSPMHDQQSIKELSQLVRSSGPQVRQWLLLDPGVTSRHVLQVLNGWLPRLWRQHRPQLVIFQAGVDALKEDAFGRSAAVSPR